MTFEAYKEHYNRHIISLSWSFGRGNSNLRDDLEAIGETVLFSIYSRDEGITFPPDAYVYKAIKIGIYRGFRRAKLLGNLHNSNNGPIVSSNIGRHGDVRCSTQRCPIPRYIIRQADYNVIYNVLFKGYDRFSLVDKYNYTYQTAEKLWNRIDRNRSYLKRMMILNA